MTASDHWETIAPSLLEFTNTFVLSSGFSDPILQEIPPNLVVDPLRQRRPHHKSKRGCDQCRKRRVKCDEKWPRCSACVRRQENCKRPSHHTGVAPPSPEDDARAAAVDSIPPNVPQKSPLETAPNDNVVNLLHMQLFHHFEHHTMSTLIFGPDVWSRAIELSFSFESLMHAILCVSARHLSILRPDETKWATAASTHLSRTLCLFRDDLSGGFNAMNIDAFMATTVLLHYEMWTNIDFVVPGRDMSTSFDPTEDWLFKHATGVTSVFLRSIPYVFDKPSPMIPHIKHSPRVILSGAARVTKATMEKFKSFFDYDAPLHPGLLSVPLPDIRDSEPDASNYWHPQVSEISESPGKLSLEDQADRDERECYAAIIPRLCLILAFLPECREPGSGELNPELLKDLSRYILTFVILCGRPFVAMVQRCDPHALVLLYHFYRAVEILLPPTECWWAQRRATAAEMVLGEVLSRECARKGA
ncbi:hypothetical protein GQ53DRAFT_672614 [Thozetella sp. PMI_491]|nr:hypothetical protein GQ53DRAFT_672614 [Thozetella sp. PMI_491]